jgi:hypothetical protein
LNLENRQQSDAVVVTEDEDDDVELHLEDLEP